jgi:phosphoglycerate dehydrogenase-like enzyme
MPAHTILVLSNPAARHLALLERLPRECRLVVGETAEIFDSAAEEADAVLCGGAHRALLQQIWPRLKSVRWIHALAAGLDGLLFPGLVESPVPLTNSRGVFARSLAEFAIAGMMWFAKDLNRMRDQQRRRHWEQFDVQEMRNKNLGIVGYGSIGRETAIRARAFGVRIHAHKRNATLAHGDPLVDRMYTREQLPALLSCADYLLACAPLTPETRDLIGEAEFARLKPACVVMNLGRGPVINERALIRALEEKRIRGAVLDVFETEPLPAENPLWGFENVLLSPHCADHTDTWMEEAMAMFLSNYERFAAGEPLLNVADKRLGY